MENTFFLFFASFMFVQTYGASSSNIMITASSNVTCIQEERQSLLIFRRGLTDESNRLSTWTGEECCEWQGVGCDRRNGHVVKLDLPSPLSSTNNYTSNTSNWLEGKVSPSLHNLKHLHYLDLSMNNFSGQNIPEFFGSFKYLEYLNLSNSGFRGVVPHHLGNLSRLEYLDLSQLYEGSLMVKNDLRWVSLLSSLKHLDLSGITIGKHIDWFHPVNTLPSLLTLNLARCDIHISSIKFINFTSLNSLDLSFNGINSTIYVWLSNLTGLVHLNLKNNSFYGQIPDSIGTLRSLSFIKLSYNHLSGPIPPSLGSLSSLRLLSLAYNQLSGSIPESIGQLSMLKNLHLENNQLSGSIPESIGQLSMLEILYLYNNRLGGSIPTSLGQLSNLIELDVSNNSLVGAVSKLHFTKLHNLTRLYLYDNSLTLNVSPHWIPPFHLKTFSARSCNIGTQFPNWLQTQTNLEYLTLSNSSIRDTIPEWFENITSHLKGLDLSHNQIDGNLPRITNPGLIYLTLGKNRLTGSIPTHLCELVHIVLLDLSDNNFSGVLPKCLGNLIQLRVMDLTNNTIIGDIPKSLGFLSYLESLHLNSNKFEGNLPVALQNLTNLVTFDLGNNLLTGNIPSWIGKKLSKLKILNLQSNNFTGKISLELCQNNALRNLNLANNNITGMIPRCFYNLTGMIVTSVYFEYNVGYEENVETCIKGIKLKYTKTLKFLTSLDLSSNKFIGEIPDVLMILKALNCLNLSRNLLSGHIPSRIGDLKQMESLDISMNLLSGRIPPSLATLNFLSYLNLSFNNLSGQIPFGHQLQTLGDPSTIFGGNNELCGPTLLKSCNRDNISDTHISEKEGKDDIQDLGLLIGTVSGFVVGFLGLVGSLSLIKEWRAAYFEIIENVYTWLVLTLAQIRKKFLY